MCYLMKGDKVKVWSDDYYICGEEGVIMDDRKNNTSGREILIKDRTIFISENDLEKV